MIKLLSASFFLVALAILIEFSMAPIFNLLRYIEFGAGAGPELWAERSDPFLLGILFTPDWPISSPLPGRSLANAVSLLAISSGATVCFRRHVIPWLPKPQITLKALLAVSFIAAVFVAAQRERTAFAAVAELRAPTVFLGSYALLLMAAFSSSKVLDPSGRKPFAGHEATQLDAADDCGQCSCSSPIESIGSSTRYPPQITSDLLPERFQAS
jgi:hypothetical protein